MTLSNLIKPIFVVYVLALSIVGLGLVIQDASADHGEDPGIIKSVVAGPNTISFRDITNTNPQIITITIDDSTSKQGFLTINFEDLDSNLDSATIDMLDVTANSTTSGPAKATVTLSETDINTGIFTGILFLSTTETVDDTLQVSNGDEISIIDEEDPNVSRLSAQINGIAPGNVKITDVFIDPNSLQNEPFIQISHAVKLEPMDGATIDSSVGNAPVITISYANLDLMGNDPSLLSMYYNPGPQDFGGNIQDLAGWQEIRSPELIPDLANDPSHDPVAKTISSDILHSVYGVAPSNGQIFGPAFPALPQFCCPQDAQFMLAFKTGSIGGGGGGGLVRPGFVVNALAGANVISSFFGKGGASGEWQGSGTLGPSKPIVSGGTVSTLSGDEEGFGGILENSDSASNSLESTQTVGIGKELTFRYKVYENKGAGNIIHSTMYFFDAQTVDSNKRIDVSKSETYIMYNKGKPIQIVDPHGYFEKANFEILEIDTFNSALKYDITFAKIMPESHILLRTWDTQRYSTDSMYPNGIVVSDSPILDIDNTSSDEESTALLETTDSSFLETSNENQLTETKTTKTGFPGIPLWVKNNAMWWYEKQIENEDFVAGIQYMINEEIITIPETEISESKSDEIPQWISNIAGYWSNDLITDAEFIQAMQWLVSNGVMKV